RHDDRPFGAERAARADRDRRGQRLQDGDLDIEAAAAEQDGFDRFRDAMAADLVGAVAGHQSDDDAADDGDGHGSHPEGGVAERQVRERQPAEVGDVGEEADEIEQYQAGDRTGGADQNGDARDQENARLGGEVPEAPDLIERETDEPPLAAPRGPFRVLF